MSEPVDLDALEETLQEQPMVPCVKEVALEAIAELRSLRLSVTQLSQLYSRACEELALLRTARAKEPNV